MQKTQRILLTTLGFVMLALGAIGAVLPLMPTTPFLLAAAACFSRSFPRLEAWLVNHPRLGPPLLAWRRSGAIPTGAKAIALVSTLASYAIFLSTTEAALPVQIVVGLTLSGCSAFILSRPRPMPAGRQVATTK